ncbi:DUF2848 family protein [Saccharothrix algeriensis]|uniref:4-hydroxyphenylacetate 3-monooxygenase n=1 Tax=Saccharothrix algeriensis TaxID=173560 RepID=A0A8T8I2P9_9PSEU|nr:DUF2848 family protein [Saccharothrix algeriensis]MBM7811201.1 4-hydroxyphenylacetate 3-monooxygenase [Saccharothrix algeriensis]QTR05115.1 DUF2848 family protein [Saccharothrix algeriensis]
MTVVLHVAGSGEELALTPARLVVAGYTARDVASVEAHIEELAAIGVPRPPSVPAFYDLDPALLTTDAVVAVGGPATSGEVEPVVIRSGGRHFLGVGSDHTDRDLERADIAAAKAACPKPLGARVVEVDLATADWAGLLAESSVDGWQYQRGPVSTLRHPVDLLDRMAAVLGPVEGDLVLFCGTLPLLAGEFSYGGYWRVHLEVPGGPLLSHAYEIKQRST